MRAYHETYGLPITITNCANNYGPYQFPEKVIPLFTTLALDDRPLPLYASTENRREWIHVRDHCLAVDRVLTDGVVGETYHVGTGVEASIAQIADSVLAILGKPSSLKTIVPDRPGHDRRYLLDTAKIRRELDWAPIGGLGRRPGRDGRVVRPATGRGGNRCEAGHRSSNRPGSPRPDCYRGDRLAGPHHRRWWPAGPRPRPRLRRRLGAHDRGA